MNGPGHGYALLSCYLLAHHHGGQVETAGKPLESLTLTFSNDPAGGPAGKEPRAVFQELFCLNQSWEMYFAMRQPG